MDRSAQTTRPAQSESRLAYLPGLDGLRALAVIAVLVYHGNYALLPGGFLGVEVFFVISGYLITSLLLKEWMQRGSINLPAFWLRRARRLVPAFFLVIVASLAFAVFFLPDEVAGLGSDALAATFYVTNWYFIVSQQSYFEAVGRPSLLKHLWSLAIEEQFYVVWPIVMTLLLRGLRLRWVQITILAGALASSALMAIFYLPNSDPSRVYFGTDTRAAGLLYGAFLACVWAPDRLPRRFDRLPFDAIGLGALGVLFWFCLGINQFSAALYQGGFAVVGIATVVLIAATVHPGARFGPRALGIAPARWIGLRSYGIYLWHWPVFMLTRPQLDVPFDGLPLFALRLAATLVLADISYRFVETPIRNGALGRARQMLHGTHGPLKLRLALQWGVTTLVFVFCATALGSAVADARPPAPPAYLAVESVNTIGAPAAETPTETVAEPSPTPVATATPQLAETATATATATEQPSATTTPPAEQAGNRAPSPTVTPEVEIPGNRAPSPTRAPIPPQIPAPAPPPASAPTCVAAGGRVTAIGDSVMIGATAELQRVICNIEVDAAQGRLVSSAVDSLRQQRAAGVLGAVVIVHMGSNGVFHGSQFDDMMAVLAGVRRVVVVNVKAPREWEAPNNAVLAEGVKRNPNTVLVDWHSLSVKQPNVFWNDGMHLRPEGARLFVELVAAALR